MAEGISNMKQSSNMLISIYGIYVCHMYIFCDNTSESMHA